MTDQLAFSLPEHSLKQTNQIFQNTRIDFTLSRIEKNQQSGRQSCHHKAKSRDAGRQMRQTFRTFVKEKRSYEPSRERKSFLDIKNDMQQLIDTVSSQTSQVDLMKLRQLKEGIMIGFLNQYISDVSKQNLDKAELLVLIWKNLFLLVEKSVQKICLNSHQQEKNGLIEQVDMHKKYQSAIEQLTRQKNEMKKQDERKQHFMKILVIKLREYKRQIKKMQQNLKIAAEKLNQFRTGYLQVQIQCINLTMQLRNLTQDTAKMLVKRKMALALEKTKQYKILKSKKKMRQQVRAQIARNKEQETKHIKQQFYDAFKGSLHEKPDSIAKIVGGLIEVILDKEDTEPVNYTIFNENLIEAPNLKQETHVDRQTDMQGFSLETADKKIGISAQDRFCCQMTKMRGTQTMAIPKPPVVPKVTAGFQCDFKSIISAKLAIRKTIDQSFLFENTIKTFKAKLKQNYVRSIREIPPEPSRKKTNDIEASHDSLTKSAHPSLLNAIPQCISIGIPNESANNSFTESDQSEPEVVNSGLELSEAIVQSKQTSTNLEKQLFRESRGKKKIKKVTKSITNKVSFLESIQMIVKGKDKDKINPANVIHQAYPESTVNILEDQHDIDLTLKQSTSNMLNQPNQQANFKRQIKVNTGYELKDFKKANKSVDNFKRELKNNEKNSHAQIRQTVKINEAILLGEEEAERRQSRHSSGHGTMRKTLGSTNPLRREFKIELDELFKQLNLQMAKSKQPIGNHTRAALKVKQLAKTIEYVFQIAFKSFEKTGKLKNFFYYLYEAISSSYGLSNTSYLRKKVITFARQTLQFRGESSILGIFHALLQMDEEGNHLPDFAEMNNILIMRLMRRIYGDWKMPFRFQDLAIDPEKIWQCLRDELVSYGFCWNFADSLVQNLDECNLPLTSQRTHDIFGVLVEVNRYILKKQYLILNSYEPIIEILGYQDTELISKQFLGFILQLHFLNRNELNSIRAKVYELHCSPKAQNMISKSQFAYFCCQNDLYDFSRLFYRGLNLFKMKENEEIFRKISVDRLQQYSNNWISKSIFETIIDQCRQPKQANALFHLKIKKNLLILLFLKCQDYQCQKLVQQIIGPDISSLYDLVIPQVNTTKPLLDAGTQLQPQE